MFEIIIRQTTQSIHSESELLKGNEKFIIYANWIADFYLRNFHEGVEVELNEKQEKYLSRMFACS